MHPSARKTRIPPSELRGLRNSLLATVVGVGVLLALGGPPAPALGDEASSRTVELGRERFIQYCASCHGVSATGDGRLSEILQKRPADLTKIAARRDGKFPVEEIEQFIDGRRWVAAHGEREMPVWGTRLAQEAPGRSLADREPYVKNRLRLIVAYLRSIQTP